MKSPSESLDPITSISKLIASIALVCLTSGDPLMASTITNGNLSVEVLDGNGAIGSVQLGGVEYFKSGTYVSDWGLQISTNTATFAINNAYGNEGIPVSATIGSGVITAAGLYAAAGSSVSVTRTYSLVPGLNVLRIGSNLVNNGASSITLRYFDTFDPDQSGFTNTMDRYALGSHEVAGATNANGQTVILGSLTPFTALASGSPFQIADGTTLNSFFTSPFDANGGSLDQGIHGGMEFTLGVGESFTATYLLAFGTSKANADSSFTTAAAAVSVPEPTVAMLGSASLLLLLRRRRG